MIAVLMSWSLIGWSYWMMHGTLRFHQVTKTIAAPDLTAPRAAAVRGLEDDPNQWRAARGAWTALDERELIRLLTESAHDTDEPPTQVTQQ